MTDATTPLARQMNGAATPPLRAGAERDGALRAKAEEMEAVFLSQMLAHAGVSTPRGAFSGGSAAAQFASFLNDAYAREIVRSGGIGLSEAIYSALAKRADLP